jgi:flagellar biosynthesis protein FlhG
MRQITVNYGKSASGDIVLTPSTMPMLVNVVSGKGGVGKTLTATQIALIASRQQKRVLLIDADIGLSNLDVLFSKTPRASLSDMLERDGDFKDYLTAISPRLQFAVMGMSEADYRQMDRAVFYRLLEKLQEISHKFDLVIFDTGAGIGDIVKIVSSAVHRCLVVTTPEPHAITDAYACIKVLAAVCHDQSFYLAVNMVRSQAEGHQAASRLRSTAASHLNCDLTYTGCVPYDRQFGDQVMTRSLSQLNVNQLSYSAFSAITAALLAPGKNHSAELA